tara:strand:- start:180 stop:779 length:600 start_codon:yes stop_codon:yes gene_type:complete
MKNIILIFVLLLVFNCGAATFKFKDGTVVSGYVYENDLSVGDASVDGILLVSNSKFYLHNYPVRIKEKIIDHGDGTYTVKEEVTPTPAPPTSGLLNPHPLPRCLPARINFIQFAPETLNNLYNYYSHKTKYHKAVLAKYPYNPHHGIAFDKNKAIALSVYKAANKKKFTFNSKELSYDWSRRVKKEYGSTPSLVTWLGR